MKPHLRQSVVTREWVLFAPARARRPEDYRDEAGCRTHERPGRRQDCPFCPGNEDRLGGETMRLGQAVACPNRFPAVEPGPPSQRQGDSFHHRMEGVGGHEVVVESARHDTTLALQSVEEVEQVLRVWRGRYLGLRQRPETEHVTVFKNHGARGGTSLEHPHSQIVSLPVTPWQVRTRMEEALRFHNDHGECVFCRMLREERSDRDRLVVEGRHATVFVPYAAYSPFSLWIFPHRHSSCFGTSDDEEIGDLAGVLRETLARLYHGLGDPDYNLVLRVAGRDCVGVPFFHWYLALVPRLGRAAGFELGTGMFINTSLPEDDAAYLRSVRVPEGVPLPA